MSGNRIRRLAELGRYDFSHYTSWWAILGFYVMQICRFIPDWLRMRWPVWDVWQWSLDVQHRHEKSFEQMYWEAETPAQALGMLYGRMMGELLVKAYEEADDPVQAAKDVQEELKEKYE